MKKGNPICGNDEARQNKLHNYCSQWLLDPTTGRLKTEVQKLVLDCNVLRWHNRRHERSVKLPNNMAKRFKHTHKHACTNPSSTTKPMRMFYTQITSQQQQNTEKIKNNDTGAATCSAGHLTDHFFAYVTADITQYHRLLHLP